jgi:hypothetical protein
MMSSLRASESKGILRFVVLFVLACALLRTLGVEVGTLAAGSLGVFSSLLVGVVAPVWVFVFFPTWFAWRVAWPLKARSLALASCWFSPLVRRGEHGSLRVFFGIAADQPFPAAEDIPADAWTALATMLQAERQGDFARAQLILDALTNLPQECEFSSLARRHGVEALVESAWKRQDWRALLAYANLGRGRVVELLTLLAQSQLGQPVLPWKLWACWAKAPLRRATWRATRAAAARQKVPAQVIPAPAAPPPSAGDAMGDLSRPVDVRLRHLSLLAAASRGETILARDVMALARLWRSQLEPAALAHLAARALELDVRSGSRQAESLRESVLGELTLLARSSEGDLPAPGDDWLLADLVLRVRDQAWKDMETALARIDPETYAPTIHPLAAWERWLVLRAALERLEKHASNGDLAMLWNTRISPMVWNWTCAVFNSHGKRAAWATHMMYAWVADRAELMGDLRTTVLNRENARIVLKAV